MMTRYEAWLDNKSLSEIDPAVYILDIEYSTPRRVMTAVDIPGKNGQRLISEYARNNSVSITLEIHEQDTQRRQDVCARVQEWAMRGGYLTTGDRFGQRLHVVCAEPPAIASALKWTQPLKILFTAYDQPFWEDEIAQSVTVSGAEQRTIYAPGIGYRTRVEASVTNVSGSTINALTLNAGSTSMSFSGLGLASGETLEIGYDDNGLITIKSGETSKLNKRTAQSDDDLMIQTGVVETVSASNAGVNATFRARGLYL